MRIYDVLYSMNTGNATPKARPFDNLLGQALSSGTEEKTIDFTPVISISDAKAGNALDYQCKIMASQSGSGDPAPDNIRPISGFTGASISVNGSTVTVSWQSEAGTVYGGVFDVTTGTLTMTHARVDMGTLEWNRNTNYDNPVFYVSISGRAYGNNIYMMCDTYKDMQRTYSGAGVFANNAPDLSCACASNSARVYVRDDSYTTASAFQVAMNGHYIVYELAEPITYNLTPTEITLADGANTIWADTGDSKLTYLAKK